MINVLHVQKLSSCQVGHVLLVSWLQNLPMCLVPWQLYTCMSPTNFPGISSRRHVFICKKMDIIRLIDGCTLNLLDSYVPKLIFLGNHAHIINVLRSKRPCHLLVPCERVVRDIEISGVNLSICASVRLVLLTLWVQFLQVLNENYNIGLYQQWLDDFENQYRSFIFKELCPLENLKIRKIALLAISCVQLFLQNLNQRYIY